VGPIRRDLGAGTAAFAASRGGADVSVLLPRAVGVWIGFPDLARPDEGAASQDTFRFI
jgi:hypothetical protein